MIGAMLVVIQMQGHIINVVGALIIEVCVFDMSIGFCFHKDRWEVP